MSMMSGMMHRLVELLTNLQTKPKEPKEGIALAAAQDSEQVDLLKAKLAAAQGLVKAGSHVLCERVGLLFRTRAAARIR